MAVVEVLAENIVNHEEEEVPHLVEEVVDEGGGVTVVVMEGEFQLFIFLI